MQRNGQPVVGLNSATLNSQVYVYKNHPDPHAEENGVMIMKYLSEEEIRHDEHSERNDNHDL